MDESLNAASTAAMTTTMAVSLAALILVSLRLTSRKPLLRYEPRQRVPWGELALALPLLMLLTPFLGLVLSQVEANPAVETEVRPRDFILGGLVMSLCQIGIVLVAFPALKVLCGATSQDLGLPKSMGEFLRDIGIGIFTFFASLAPVHAVQLLMTSLLKPEQDHPLIELVLKNPSLELFAVGTLMAVIVAPIFEEFAFRLLLQGWLERREDEIIGFVKSERTCNTAKSLGEIEEDSDEPTQVNAIETSTETNPSNENALDDSISMQGMLFGLPHGWAPVLISGFVFGMAHFGHGVAPIPLVLFGMVLGYLYQRTHRLVPCMVTHACFNAYSMLIMWLQVGPIG